MIIHLLLINYTGFENVYETLKAAAKAAEAAIKEFDNILSPPTLYSKFPVLLLKF